MAEKAKTWLSKIDIFLPQTMMASVDKIKGICWSQTETQICLYPICQVALLFKICKAYTL